MRGDANQVAEVCKPRTNTFSPISLLKMAKITTPGSIASKTLWVRFDLVRFFCVAVFPRSYFMLNSSPDVEFNTMKLRAANSHFCDTVIQ